MNILATTYRSVAATNESWRSLLKTAYRRPEALARALELPQAIVDAAACAHETFQLFAPQPFVDLIERGKLDDPLLRQIWPAPEELVAHPNERRDPVGDQRARIGPGLLQKYSGRALLVLTGACAVHCRYCFRKNWDYDESPQSISAWEGALQHIANDRSIREVILSGGDPLMWDDARLDGFARRISQIAHVERLRVHTRVPIVLPQRVTPELLDALSTHDLQLVVVVHANHRRELSNLVQDSFSAMKRRGIPLLNQSVLLAGVNDSADELAGLSERLFACGVTPYYLHQLDPVVGSKHFEVSRDRGRELIAELRRRLPGYLVPRYVCEVEGELSKTVLA